MREEILAADRARLGDPPSTEQIIAYSQGELSAHEEARVRELLAAYPELADAVAIPFGENDELLPAAIIDQQWQSFRRRIWRRPPQRIWQITSAMAAAIALTFGVLLWNARDELAQPRVIAAEELLQPRIERGTRGGAAITLAANAGNVVLLAPLSDQERFAAYRVDVIELAGTTRRQRASTTTITPFHDDLLRILVPARSLEPGQYEIVIHGLSGALAKELERYPIAVEAPRK